MYQNVCMRVKGHLALLFVGSGFSKPCCGKAIDISWSSCLLAWLATPAEAMVPETVVFIHSYIFEMKIELTVILKVDIPYGYRRQADNIPGPVMYFEFCSN